METLATWVLIMGAMVNSNMVWSSSPMLTKQQCENMRRVILAEKREIEGWAASNRSNHIFCTDLGSK